MELNPSSEAANCAATQELPNILWNPKVHYLVHKSPPLVPTLSQIGSVHTIPSYPISALTLSTHLRLVLPSTVLSEPALYKLLIFPVPNLMSIFFSLGRLSKESIQVRGPL
jgi:hypothetical protein